MISRSQQLKSLFICFSMAFLLIFILSGCNSDDDASSNPDPAPAPTATPTSVPTQVPAPDILTPVCDTVEEGNSLTLNCPSGQVIKEVTFASYGNPGGTCGSFTTGSCSASNSLSIVSDACKGKSACTVKTGNENFDDPCYGTIKKLAAQVACGMATDSAPTQDPTPIPTQEPTGVPTPTGDNVAPLAAASTSYVSSWETLSAINDNSNPSSSNDKSSGAYGNWDTRNSTQWVQYDWPQNYRLSSTEIYWFDDNKGVLAPTTAYFEYWDGYGWVNAGNIPLEKDTFNVLSLDDIVTNRVRVSMLNSSQSTGILEWRVIGAAATGACTGPAIGSQGSNPIAPQIFTADPAVLVHNCTFYITAGHDEGSTGYVLRDWYLLSSTDMVNWSDNGGPVLSLDVFSWADANAWASQMVERNGKFYWYVAVKERAGSMAIGVAVADSPLGPFQDAIGAPLVNDAVEMRQFNYAQANQTAFTIDPTVFVDDNGQAYLAYGGSGRMVTVELGDDMISLKGNMVERTPQGYKEAAYLSKRNDSYYTVYAAGSNPATIDYATSRSPMGPWQYGGRILDALPGLPGEIAPTSHPAIAEFAGQWYLVYHRSDSPGGGTHRRQVAIEKLTFNADGTIQKVTPSSGLSFTDDGTGNHPPEANIGAVTDQISGQTVILDGSGSSDPEGDRLSYIWKQTEGEPVTLSDYSSQTLSFVAPAVTQPTSFTFELTVGDGNLSDTASVQIQVTPVVDTTAAVIISRTPQSGQGGVSTTTAVSVTFSKPLSADLINDQSLQVIENGSPLPGVVTYDSASYTITNRLSSDLSPGTRYTVTIAGGLQDQAGNAVSGESWSFTTTGGDNDVGNCDFPEPPANVAAWINESWDAQLSKNISNRQAWLLDSAMKGKGEINLCLRWGANRQLTAAERDRIAPSMQRWFNGWFKALGAYGCFPYPEGVTVKLTGVAVKPGQESRLEWSDNSVPIYTETDAQGEPMCPDSCSFFKNWNHEFPNCAGGEASHFDYSVWLNDSLSDGMGGHGGDWGLRMPVDDFILGLNQSTDHTVQHEMGHSFGMQDYYDWTGSRPEGGSVMIIGTSPETAPLTVGDRWLIRRIWKEQKSQRGW